MTSRLEQVALLRSEDPRLRAINIAKQIGCSRELVRQILLRLRLPTNPTGYRVRTLRHCRNCGGEISYRRWKGESLCRACKWRKYHVLVTCTECGKTFERERRQMRAGALLTRSPSALFQMLPQTKFFCNRDCQARWGGKNYGYKNLPHKGPQAQCKRGHPLEGDNLYVSPFTGARHCKACQRYRRSKKRKEMSHA